jgi:hypothetical protein
MEFTNEAGELHRTDGPAMISVNGTESWWLNGKRHRINGPAVEYSDGTKSWFINGERHREDGPACEGHGIEYWYVNGKEVTEEEHNEMFPTTNVLDLLDQYS